MKHVFITLAVHVITIILFTLIYSSLSYEHFNNFEENQPQNILDWLYLSVNIQSGVGYSDNFPITPTSKACVIIQELLLICINISALFYFLFVIKSLKIL